MAVRVEELPTADDARLRLVKPRNTVRCDNCETEILVRVRRSSMFSPIEDAGVARVRLLGFGPDGSAWIACNACGHFRSWAQARKRPLSDRS
jgi:DNA-directed RNA polymerase subunit RPC12/RpoP